ncbi:MAG: glycosyl hydrolase [Spirochaetales bacterium]|jgi:unsaturated chondroitin disaccharide hydrolase|nr:glycosyl hydrolase [Spirochaetales bacterium]
MQTLNPADLTGKIAKFWDLSGKKIISIESNYDFAQGSPVFTRDGIYTTRGWTEWTEGFVYGSAVLQYDAAGEDAFLEIAKRTTVERMAKHVSHIGVHDHGFNNVSTYGGLLRLMNEKKIPEDPWERAYYEFALKISGAVQASRWTDTSNGGGYIYSFNGPHSLFADTIRSLRALGVAHQLGHVLMAENDRAISLLDRFLTHAVTTSKYIVYFGEGRDSYDIPGRTVHEAIFNTNDGNFRNPSTQQGYSAFSTWTRGLAWIVTGFAEELEFLSSLSGNFDAAVVMEKYGGIDKVKALFEKTAKATADFYIANSCSDNIPYWDTGAPGLHNLGDYLAVSADPYNNFEPVDSSAAAIAAQGLLRLGVYFSGNGAVPERGVPANAIENPYFQAGLKIIDTLLDEPYLSTDDAHQGLLLHSIYHQPNGWDNIPAGRVIPCDESSMWGDYHIREAILYLHKIIHNEPYYTYWLK